MNFLLKNVFELDFHVKLDLIFGGIVIIDESWNVLHQNSKIILRNHVEVQPISDLIESFSEHYEKHNGHQDKDQGQDIDDIYEMLISSSFEVVARHGVCTNFACQCVVVGTVGSMHASICSVCIYDHKFHSDEEHNHLDEDEVERGVSCDQENIISFNWSIWGSCVAEWDFHS